MDNRTNWKRELLSIIDRLDDQNPIHVRLMIRMYKMIVVRLFH